MAYAVDQAIRFDLLLKHVPPAPRRVLEVGFGQGHLLQRLRADGYHVKGCEANPHCVADARRRLPGNGLFVASGSALPLPDASFDCTVSCDVFEHVRPEHRHDFLTEVFRVTRPGGTVAMTVWLTDTLTFRLHGACRLLANRSLPTWYLEHMEIPHPRFDAIHNFFLAHSSDVRVQHYQGSLNLLAMTLQHLAGRRRRTRFVARWMTALKPFVERFDCFGRKTSCLLVGRKK